MIKNIKIKTDMIQLDQLLKLADVIATGGQIRMFLDAKKIFVNGELCQVKRKQLHDGDVVEVKGCGTYRVCGE
ncbi:RNA-binding S4 domain-containing protein [Megasphaera hominis]|jgi:ribosome-associated protein|uniref:RNA-binding S4 domain-containing protein n=1 Tax=Megasphaera hominis TaxID=159836 RepID=UPI001C97D9F1|nr:RNA-binding S4 domain-containing protein [Megasphaera hominis]